MTSDFAHHPVDPEAAGRLSGSGLRLGLVDTDDAGMFRAWLQATSRGFHGSRQDQESLAASMAGLAHRRTTGVWEEGADAVSEPVGTVSSWPAELSLPGGHSVEAWAVSSVSVSPAHRRRGIARAMLEAELATASALGAPLSILTVSESTIYGRFGFAPAVFATNLTIETRRATWVGPLPEGRLRFVTLDDARALLPELHDRGRGGVPGQIDVWGLRWDQFVALAGDDRDRAKKLRAIRYDDAAGVVQGLALYRATGGEEDFTKHVLELEFLLSTTGDAYAALWRFVLGMDLVSEVRAYLRSVDEPLRWQVADQRAIKESIEDHLWVRILDVPIALEARGYAADGRIGLEVSDVYGYAAGRFLLTAGGGAGSVTRVEGAFPDGVPALAMTVNELSSLYLGAVSATVLAASGRVTELTPDAGAAAAALFRSPVTPWLNVWF
ncbi:GNAT family N-acetyltransferase [Leifsonia bigeumensis]|uniref:GNAT family N-acetyltransferase n=1 Tax=Leifsonella bigeumensis TaxID=433643 RepID=A0ABP7FYA3_9MICO